MRFPTILAGGLSVIALLAAAAPASAQQEGSWLDRVKFSADMRARAEANDNLNPAADRHRLRTRFRFGAKFDLGEEWSAGVRARSGSADDPNSPHQDLGGTGGALFNSFELALDQVYVTYEPQCLEGFSTTFGKFSNPMKRNPVYGDFMWDQDVQPEGVQVTWNCPWQDDTFTGIGATLGQYVILENGAAEDIWSTFTQVYGSASLGGAGKLDGAISYYFVGDTTPDGAVSPLLGDNQGNAVTATDFASQFGVFNPMLAWSKDIWTVSTEFFSNTRAFDGAEDTGVTVGGAVKTGIGRFYYTYASIGQDAVFSPWTQDDFLLGTNMNSHLIGWKRPLNDMTTLHVWALASEADDPALGGPDDLVYRFRVDLDFVLL